ncbi:hypothetical protein KIL84_016561 [Mauremys mutica]|uniref:Uncharacterized protein n=1 Tax=Mauremys mutica TaxID=74926 RepID=A0A9D4AQV2_9SAUR|nr:hypothetical protein KIL84_016561 [Mauremys mutica]
MELGSVRTFLPRLGCLSQSPSELLSLRSEKHRSTSSPRSAQWPKGSRKEADDGSDPLPHPPHELSGVARDLLPQCAWEKSCSWESEQVCTTHFLCTVLSKTPAPNAHTSPPTSTRDVIIPQYRRARQGQS